MRYEFKNKELDIIKRNIGIAIDTREQENDHIIEYFNRVDAKKKKPIKHKQFSLGQGDYSAYIEANEETKAIGITRDILLSDLFVIERKNGIDELIGNFVERERLEKEFQRLNKYRITCQLWVEDKEGYYKLLKGDYRSEYNKSSAEATYNTFQARYGIPIVFVDKKEMGYRLSKYLLYSALDAIKNRGYIE